jgi:hypothetical protein
MIPARLGEPSPSPEGAQLVRLGHPSTPVRQFCPNQPPAWWLPASQHCAQDHELQRRYGITCDDYWSLFADQDGVCGVCRRPPWPGRRLVVDHDHDTGSIDGLCHFGCNRRITPEERRYLTDPPGRQAGLRVAPAKLEAIQERDAAKRRRAQARRAQRQQAAAARAVDNGLAARIQAALEQTNEQGGT